MARGGFSVEIVEDSLSPNLVAFPDKVDRALAGVTEYHATRAEGYMRENAPWTDRTSVARNGLFATAEHEHLHHTIICYHTARYGIWLEVAHNGQYRIIVPTIVDQGRETMETVRGLFRRIG